MTAPAMTTFSGLWNAARARQAAAGTKVTLQRVHRETGVPVATLSDWRTGHHAPRDTDRFLAVVSLLCRWADLPPPNVREWMRLVDQSNGPRTGRSSSAATDNSLRWLPTTVALADRVSAGFSAEHVELDALCLTGQSLALAVARPVQDIHAGRIRPKTISVRVLLPSRDIDLAFPASVSAEPADRDLLHQHWLAQRNIHAHSLRTALLSLRTTHGLDVEISFRSVPFTPMAEVYVINTAEALFAYCIVRQREEMVDGEPHDCFDALTEMALQRRFVSDEADAADTIFVEQSAVWFNSLWETVSVDMELAP